MRTIPIYFFVCTLSIIALLFSCQNHKNREKASSEEMDSLSQTQEFRLKIDDLDFQELERWKEDTKKEFPNSAQQPFLSDQNSTFILPDLDSVSYSSAEWEQFQPYFVFSPNKKRAIDLYSYDQKVPRPNQPLESGDPDSEVNLVNLKKRTKARLLFAGPGTYFQSAAWKDDHTILITGKTDANPQNEWLPTIWEIDLDNRKIKEYQPLN